MKDFLGNTIEVGDYVVCKALFDKLEVDIVNKITPKMLVLNKYKHIYPSKVIRVDPKKGKEIYDEALEEQAFRTAMELSYKGDGDELIGYAG